jgi:hypothetical protein
MNSVVKDGVRYQVNTNFFVRDYLFIIADQLATFELSSVGVPYFVPSQHNPEA